MYKLKIMFNCAECGEEHTYPAITEDVPQFGEPYKEYKCKRCKGQLLVTKILEKKVME